MRTTPRLRGSVAVLPHETPARIAGRSLGRDAAIGVVIVALFLAARLAAGDGAEALRAAHAITALAAAAAAGAALASGWGRDAQTRQTWALIAVGCTVWSIGRLAATVEPGLPREGIEAVARANAGYLAMIPLVCAGLLQLVPAPRPIARGDVLRLALDLLIALMSLLTITWFFVLGPIWLESAAPDYAKRFATAHALGNVALLLAAIASGLRLGDRPLPPVLMAFAAGVLGFVVADTLSLVRWLDDRAAAGIVAETAWLAGFLGLGLAGLWSRRSSRVERRRVGATALEIEHGQEPFWRAALPYVLATVLLFLTAWQEVTHHLGRFSASILVGCLTVVGIVILRQALTLRDARRLTRHLSQQVDRDPLTGLINHRKVHERVDRELIHGAACGHPVAIALIDVDDFKRVNDSHGHQVGDHVLRTLGAILAAACRGTDVAGRYAGDEFLLVLPGVGLSDARAVAERVMLAVRARAADCAGVPGGGIGLSIGVAVTFRCQRSSRQLVAIADAAMYDAKEAGKNRVRVVDADTLIAEPDPGPEFADGARSPVVLPREGRAPAVAV